jgi:hypothetical protein
MAVRKTSNNSLTSFEQDWGCDKEDNSLPFSGKAIQDFIKQKIKDCNSALDTKVGYTTVTSGDTDNNMYLIGFADQKSYEDWVSDKESYSNNALFSCVIPGLEAVATVNKESAYLYTSGNTTVTTIDGKVYATIKPVYYLKTPADAEAKIVEKSGTLTVYTASEGSSYFTKKRSVAYVSSIETAEDAGFKKYDISDFISVDTTTQVRLTWSADDSNASNSAKYTVTYTTLTLAYSNDSIKVIRYENNPGGLSFNTTGVLSKTLYVTINELEDGGENQFTVSYIDGIPCTHSQGSLVGTKTTNIPLGSTLRPGNYTGTAFAYVNETLQTDKLEFQFCVLKADSTDLKLSINNASNTIYNWAENTYFSYAIYGKTTADIKFILWNEDFSEKYAEYTESDVKSGIVNNFKSQTEIELNEGVTGVTAIMRAYDANSTVAIDNNTEYLAQSTFFINSQANYSPTQMAGGFIFSPKGRSNIDADKEVIYNKYNGDALTGTTWTNMDWLNGGWIADSDGSKCLRILAGSKVNIPYNVFEDKNLKSPITVEVDFAIRNVSDDSNIVINLATSHSVDSGSTMEGLSMYPNVAYFLLNNQNGVLLTKEVEYQEDTRTHLALNILPDYTLSINGTDYTKNIVRMYINGVINREYLYNPGSNNIHYGVNSIIIGSDTADVDLYGIRIYQNTRLDSVEIQKDYLSSLPSLAKKQDFSDRNDITSVGNEISYAEACKKYRTLLWEGDAYPCYINKLDEENGTEGDLTVRYVKSTKDADGNYEVDTVNSCIIKKAICKGQGSTAKTYYKWNGSWKFGDNSSYLDIYGQEIPDHNYYVYSEEDSSTGEYVAVTPKATKLVGKLNYASSMQSHKQGSLRMYEDIRNLLGFKSEIQQTEGLELSRMSVREDEFLFFVKTPTDSAPVFYGLMTWGAGKGDKATFGYDKKKTPEMLMVGGSNQECPITLCHSPWLTDEVKFDGKEEFIFNRKDDNGGSTSQEAFDLELGNDASIGYVQDYLNFVYSCSHRLSGCSATSSSDFSNLKNLDKTYQYWYYDTTDSKYYAMRHDYVNYVWVDAGTTKDEEGNTISAKLDLIEDLDGYFTENIFKENGSIPNVYSGCTSGLTGSMDGDRLTAFNQLSTANKTTIFRRARAAKLRANINEYVDIEEVLLCFCFTLFIAASDNLSKNQYFLVDKTINTVGRPKIRPWRDDDDTIFRINNEGMKDKPYWAEYYTTHKDDKGNTVNYFTANNSGYYGTLLYVYLQDFIDRNVKDTPSIRTIMNKMIGAMSSLGSNSSYIIDNDSIMGCFNRYYFSVQNYFPAVAYNETARLLYEEAEILNQSGVEAFNISKNSNPITMSMGDCLEGEKQYVKMRVFFMKTFAMYSNGLNKFGYALSGGNNSVTVTAAAHMYAYSLQGENNYQQNHPTLLSPGGKVALTLPNNGSTDTSTIVGIEYMSDMGDWSNKFISPSVVNKSLKFNSKRVTSFIGGGTNPTFNITDIETLPQTIEKLDLSNVTTLSSTVDLTNYYRLKTVYLENTHSSEVKLPQSNSLKNVTLPSLSSLTTLTINKAPNCNMQQLLLKNYVGLESITIVCDGNPDNTNDYFGYNYQWILDWYNNIQKYATSATTSGNTSGNTDTSKYELSAKTISISNIYWSIDSDKLKELYTTVLGKVSSLSLTGSINVTDFEENIADKINSFWPGYNEIDGLAFNFINPYNTIFGSDDLEAMKSEKYSLATYAIDIDGDVSWSVDNNAFVALTPDSDSTSAVTLTNSGTYGMTEDCEVTLTAQFMDKSGNYYNPSKKIIFHAFRTLDTNSTSIQGEFILDSITTDSKVDYKLAINSLVNKPYYVVWSVDDEDYLTSDILGQTMGYYQKDNTDEDYQYASIRLTCAKFPDDIKTVRLTATIYDSVLSGSVPAMGDELFTVTRAIYLGEKALDTFGWIYCSDGSLVSTIDEIPTGKLPIGVCVVPKRHTLRLSNESYSGTDKSYAGTARIMSLNEMSYNTPDAGTSGTSRCGIIWGGYGTLDIPELINKNKTPRLYKKLGDYSSQMGSETNYNGNLTFHNTEGTYADNLYYYRDFTTTSISGACQNPYLIKDGTMTDYPNPYYYTNASAETRDETDLASGASGYYDANTTNNSCGDLDGAGNTEKILNYALSQMYWHLAETIKNSSGANYYPAACCCWRYHVSGDEGVVGTQQGDWYLPAIGELAYIIPRMGRLNTILSAIAKKYPALSVVTLYTGYDYWSSSELSSSNAWYVYTGSGNVSYGLKLNSFYVRAFLAV